MKADGDFKNRLLLFHFKNNIMETIQTQSRYIEWLSPEEMHKASKEWLSELKFIRDEHLFFEDLVTTFTSQLIASRKFQDNKEIIDAINKSQKRNNVLIESIKVHENDLEVMLDGIDQIEEERAYVKEHSGLIKVISDYLKNYKSLKTQLFNIIKNIKKEDKQRYLMDRK
ncbi:hypothetical protein FBALC1_06643 [Flavobacteriales bacterium ALC-1]|nr:hypothetical protein FBALC1_06643 [Flavobacteriales bacterium ALC-1]